MMIKSQKGMITVDFIFAIVLIFGFTALLFVMSFSMSVASLTQYITFASARNYVVAHVDKETQERRAQEKYKELINNPVFRPLYSNGWYQIDAEPFVGDQTQRTPEYQEAAKGVNQFVGVGTTFVARILDFRIPFYGSTAPDSDGSGDGFKAYIGSYLGREPSSAECMALVDARWSAIQSLNGAYGSAANASYFPMTDDGC